MARLTEMQRQISDIDRKTDANANTLARELATVSIRRQHLDERLDRIDETLNRVSGVVENAISFAKFGRWVAAAIAAIGASLVGLMGWWESLVAKAQAWFR